MHIIFLTAAEVRSRDNFQRVKSPTNTMNNGNDVTHVKSVIHATNVTDAVIALCMLGLNDYHPTAQDTGVCSE
jgi:hypothetical protein